MATNSSARPNSSMVPSPCADLARFLFVAEEMIIAAYRSCASHDFDANMNDALFHALRYYGAQQPGIPVLVESFCQKISHSLAQMGMCHLPPVKIFPGNLSLT